MASELDICNLALQHLGESRVTSTLDTGDKPSRTCATNYPHARDEVLALAPWACAKNYVEIPLVSPSQPSPKWQAAYLLPLDFVRLVEVGGISAWHPSDKFDRMGNLLYVGKGEPNENAAETLGIEYISRGTDADRFDPLLVEAISVKLAMKMARTLTGSDGKARELREELERVIMPQARTANAAQLYTGANNPLTKRLSKSLFGPLGRISDEY